MKGDSCKEEHFATYNDLNDEPSTIVREAVGHDTESHHNNRDGDGKHTKEEENEEPSAAVKNEHQRPVHPLEHASWFSKLLFLWPYELLRLGLQHPLTDWDLAQVRPKDSSFQNLQHFSHNIWSSPGQNLRLALLKEYFRSTLHVQPLFGLVAASKIVQAVCIGNLIATFEEQESRTAYLWAMGLVLCGAVNLVCFHQIFFAMECKSLQLRVPHVAALYDNALRLSSTRTDTLNSSNGRIMNLASNDVERFLLASAFLNFIVWSPLQAVGIWVVGSVLVGPASFATGMALLLGEISPFQMDLAHRFGQLRRCFGTRAYARINFVAQAIRDTLIMNISDNEEMF